jgi:hypothetical protein
MSLRTVATALAVGRVAIGAALVVAPERIARAWIGPVATERSVEVVVRSVGIRDVALGAGGAAALLSGSDSARAWMLGAAAADFGDLIATLLARDVLPANGVAATAALAGGSTIVCAATATQI